MAVELSRVSAAGYKPISGTVSQPRIGRANLTLVSSNQPQTNASKAALNASMERAQSNQQYWEDLLEKLRRAGGGGGGDDKRFDRIGVSMMLSNLLNKKIIEAMLRNFGVELFGLNNTSDQINNTGQNISGKIIYIFSDFVLNIVNPFIGIIAKNLGVQNIPKISLALSSFVAVLSFQMNKLKEILEEALKEFIKKLDVKEKMRKVKAALTDFFVEMKDTLFTMSRFFTEKIFSLQLKQASHELYK